MIRRGLLAVAVAAALIWPSVVAGGEKPVMLALADVKADVNIATSVCTDVTGAFTSGAHCPKAGAKDVQVAGVQCPDSGFVCPDGYTCCHKLLRYYCSPDSGC